MPCRIVGKYKFQLGHHYRFCMYICMLSILNVTLKQVCNLSKLGGEEFHWILHLVLFGIFYTPVPSVPV